MAGVLTNANAGLRWLTHAPPNIKEARQALDRIVRDGNRASNVIEHIRMLSTSSGTAKERLDLNGIIIQALTLVIGEVQRNAVVVRTELTADLPPVLGDPVQLQQVLLNLIMNGVEAMSGVKDRERELVIRTGKASTIYVLPSKTPVQDSVLRALNGFLSLFIPPSHRGWGSDYPSVASSLKRMAGVCGLSRAEEAVPSSSLLCLFTTRAQHKSHKLVSEMSQIDDTLCQGREFSR